jgi:hypothetical protein
MNNDQSLMPNWTNIRAKLVNEFLKKCLQKSERKCYATDVVGAVEQENWSATADFGYISVPEYCPSIPKCTTIVCKYQENLF